MTETEQRIERVARAMVLSWGGDPDTTETVSSAMPRPKLWELYAVQARAADAISFAAGWDAAVQFAVLMEKTPPGEALQSVADYLAAHRPGETT